MINETVAWISNEYTAKWLEISDYEDKKVVRWDMILEYQLRLREGINKQSKNVWLGIKK